MEHLAERFVDDITRIHRALSQTSDLRPSQLVNGLFEELVSLCTQTLSTSVTKKASTSSYFYHVVADLNSDTQEQIHPKHHPTLTAIMRSSREPPRVPLGRSYLW